MCKIVQKHLVLRFFITKWQVCKLHSLKIQAINYENLKNRVFVKLTVTKQTCLFISNLRFLSESASLGSHFRENLQQTHFSVVLPASGLISLQQSFIESNKQKVMMKYYFDVLPAKFEQATPDNS